jgi:tryptophanyl-tRNA synthetase
MSKSYDNVLPLFAPREQLKKQIFGVITDSRAPGEPKTVEGSSLFQIYEAFASKEETDALRREYERGISWADAKQLLFERIDREIAPMREKYDALVGDPAQIERTLQRGAEKARALAAPLMAELKAAVGLRNLADQAGRAKKKEKAALPSFKQYREEDGRFYFKFLDASGRLLAQSRAFDSPQQAGRVIAELKKGTPLDDPGLAGTLTIADGVAAAEFASALAALSAG